MVSGWERRIVGITLISLTLRNGQFPSGRGDERDEDLTLAKKIIVSGCFLGGLLLG